MNKKVFWSKILVIIGAIISIVPYFLVIGLPLLIIGYVIMFKAGVAKKTRNKWLLIPVLILGVLYSVLTIIGG